MYCKNCGKVINDDAQYCKYCGTYVNEINVTNNNEVTDNKVKETIMNDKHMSKKYHHQIIVTILCLVALSYAIFSPIKFEVQIMGISAEVKISYDLVMQKAKFRVGSLGFDKDNVSIIDFINMKLNVVNHFLFGSDLSSVTKTIYNENQQESHTDWYNRALIEYSSNEELRKNFFTKNLFKSKEEKEKNFSNLVQQLKLSADNVSEVYYNSYYYSSSEINEEYVRKYIKVFNRLGFDIDNAEGQYYFRPYYPYLLQTFGIPKAWKEYIELSYSRQNDFGEAYCKLSADEIRNAINQYDKFILKYPNFVNIEEVKKDQNSYIYSYLHGFDNGRIFDYETNRIKEEYKKSIDNFLKEDTRFSKYDLVNEYYNKIKKNNYKINEDISNWLWEQLF